MRRIIDFATNKAFIHRMKSGEYLYVWKLLDWPQWRYNAIALTPLLAQVHQALGQLLGRMRDQGGRMAQ